EPRPCQRMSDELQHGRAAAWRQPAVDAQYLGIAVGWSEVAGLSVGDVAGHASAQLEAPASLRRVAHLRLDPLLHTGCIGGVARHDDLHASTAAVERRAHMALGTDAVAGSAGEPRIGAVHIREKNAREQKCSDRCVCMIHFVIFLTEFLAYC